MTPSKLEYERNLKYSTGRADGRVGSHYWEVKGNINCPC